MEQRKPYRHIELLESFQRWAHRELPEFPEALSLALVIGWEIGENDLPPGEVCYREGPSPPAMLGTVRQLAKTAALVMNEVAARAASAEMEAAKNKAVQTAVKVDK